MLNKSLTKSKMPALDPLERVKHFDEVTLGYALEQAIDEAKRCLMCKHQPCVDGCPVRIDIPKFIHAVSEGDIIKAYHIISESSLLPSVCGRVCPQESQCEAVCVRSIKGEAVAIGYLERFVADYYFENYQEEIIKVKKNGFKVAIVGSGPASLSCAHDLVKLGYDVTIYEALHIPGGVLIYGIPEFRLPKEIVEREIDRLKKLGVTIVTNVIIGKSLMIEDLFQMGNEAVFIGTGAGLPKFMNIKGENLLGVYSANEFLTRMNLMKAYLNQSHTPIQHAKKVAVIGGGNVALDAARSAKRLGAKEVMIIYRRSEKELPARLEEVHHAKEEGIHFHLLTNIKEIIGDEQGFVKAIKCIKMTLGEPDASKRRSPIELIGSDFIIEVDSVIMAIGTSPNPLISNTTSEIKTNKYGCFITKDEGGETTMDMVFAGGDVVTGSATVILAMGAGRNAAKAIHEKISNSVFEQ